MFGKYSQNRSRLILAAAIGSGLIWSGVRLPRPAQAQAPDPSTQLYVSEINVGWSYSGNSKTPWVRVDIVDGIGNPVNGALVVGDWSGCFIQQGASDATETVCTTYSDGTTVCVDGRAIIWGKKYTCKKGKNCPFTFTITKVEKNGMTYVAVAGKTSSSILSLCN